MNDWVEIVGMVIYTALSASVLFALGVIVYHGWAECALAGAVATVICGVFAMIVVDHWLHS